jgi:hypothetical protein
MPDPLSKADRYRKEAVKYYELAKSASPGFLRDCYRSVAVRYLIIAEGELKLAGKTRPSHHEAERPVCYSACKIDP